MHKHIGELDLRNRRKETRIPADSPALMRIYRIAAESRVPVSIHYNFAFGTDLRSGMAELERAVAGNPDTIFIAAHHVNIELMRKHPNLWGEVDCYPLRRIYEQDSSLFDRIVIGTDWQDPGIKASVAADGRSGPRVATVPYVRRIRCIREELGKLPAAVAEDVAYKNLRRILPNCR